MMSCRRHSNFQLTVIIIYSQNSLIGKDVNLLNSVDNGNDVRSQRIHHEARSSLDVILKRALHFYFVFIFLYIHSTRSRGGSESSSSHTVLSPAKVEVDHVYSFPYLPLHFHFVGSRWSSNHTEYYLLVLSSLVFLTTRVCDIWGQSISSQYIYYAIYAAYAWNEHWPYKNEQQPL